MRKSGFLIGLSLSLPIVVAQDPINLERNPISLFLVIPAVVIFILLLFLVTATFRRNITRFFLEFMSLKRMFSRKPKEAGKREDGVKEEGMSKGDFGQYIDRIDTFKKDAGDNPEDVFRDFSFIVKDFFSKLVGLSHAHTDDEITQQLEKRRKVLAEFSKKISDMKYSGYRPSKAEIENLVLDFKKIVASQMRRHKEVAKTQASTNLIAKVVEEDRKIFDTIKDYVDFLKKEDKKKQIHEMLSQEQKILRSNVSRTKGVYDDILKLYVQLSPEERKKIYPKLIDFYNNVNKMVFSSIYSKKSKEELEFFSKELDKLRNAPSHPAWINRLVGIPQNLQKPEFRHERKGLKSEDLLSVPKPAKPVHKGFEITLRVPRVRIPKFRLPKIHLPKMRLPERHKKAYGPAAEKRRFFAIPKVRIPKIRMSKKQQPGSLELPELHIPSSKGVKVGSTVLKSSVSPVSEESFFSRLKERFSRREHKILNPVKVKTKLVVPKPKHFALPRVERRPLLSGLKSKVSGLFKREAGTVKTEPKKVKVPKIEALKVPVAPEKEHKKLFGSLKLKMGMFKKKREVASVKLVGMKAAKQKEIKPVHLPKLEKKPSIIGSFKSGMSVLMDKFQKRDLEFERLERENRLLKRRLEREDKLLRKKLKEENKILKRQLKKDESLMLKTFWKSPEGDGKARDVRLVLPKLSKFLGKRHESEVEVPKSEKKVPVAKPPVLEKKPSVLSVLRSRVSGLLKKEPERLPKLPEVKVPKPAPKKVDLPVLEKESSLLSRLRSRFLAKPKAVRTLKMRKVKVPKVKAARKSPSVLAGLKSRVSGLLKKEPKRLPKLPEMKVPKPVHHAKQLDFAAIKKGPSVFAGLRSKLFRRKKKRLASTKLPELHMSKLPLKGKRVEVPEVRSEALHVKKGPPLLSRLRLLVKPEAVKPLKGRKVKVPKPAPKKVDLPVLEKESSLLSRLRSRFLAKPKAVRTSEKRKVRVAEVKAARKSPSVLAGLKSRLSRLSHKRQKKPLDIPKLKVPKGHFKVNVPDVRKVPRNELSLFSGLKSKTLGLLKRKESKKMPEVKVPKPANMKKVEAPKVRFKAPHRKPSVFSGLKSGISGLLKKREPMPVKKPEVKVPKPARKHEVPKVPPVKKPEHIPLGQSMFSVLRSRLARAIMPKEKPSLRLEGEPENDKPEFVVKLPPLAKPAQRIKIAFGRESLPEDELQELRKIKSVVKESARERKKVKPKVERPVVRNPNEEEMIIDKISSLMDSAQYGMEKASRVDTIRRAIAEADNLLARGDLAAAEVKYECIKPLFMSLPDVQKRAVYPEVFSFYKKLRAALETRKVSQEAIRGKPSRELMSEEQDLLEKLDRLRDSI